MAASIIDTLKQLMNRRTSLDARDQAGRRPSNVSRAGSRLGPRPLSPGSRQLGDASAMSRTFDLISKPEPAMNAIADDVALAREGRQPNEVGNMSARFFVGVVGDRASLVNNVVSESSGLSAQSTGT